MTVVDHGLERIDGEPLDAAAVAAVQSLCGWHVWPVVERTVELVALGDRQVMLPTKRLVELVSVSVSGVPVDVGRVEVFQDGILVLPSRPRPGSKITVVMRDGFEQVPDLEAVVASMARRAAQPQEAYRVGAIQVGSPAGFTPQSSEWRIIDRYRLEALP